MPATFLVVAAPPGGLAPGARITLPDGRHLVGRARDSAICLGGDRLAHRRHAALEVAGESVQIVDCGGGSRVLVDGAAVARAALPVGARVLLGATELARVAADPA